jgi:hypothetical protein
LLLTARGWESGSSDTSLSVRYDEEETGGGGKNQFKKYYASLSGGP